VQLDGRCGHDAAVAAAEPLGRHSEADELVQRQTEPPAARQCGARKLHFGHHDASRVRRQARGRQLQECGLDVGFAVEEAIEMGVGERVGGFFQSGAQRGDCSHFVRKRVGHGQRGSA
jgi:hypothetical protein